MNSKNLSHCEKKVVIIGGGFGGLSAAKKLANTAFEVTLIDKTNFHLFQPLLYQVATAALSPGDIAAPIRWILRKAKNISIIMGEVISIDLENKAVELHDDKLNFDYLIIAIGSRHSYFGKNEWEKFAPGLKTITDAISIREKILLSFEKAERVAEQENVDKYMTFVIVGGGPTGVEMAGAIAEIAKQTMLRDFRRIDPSKAKIILIEGENRILPLFDPHLSEKARKSLEGLGVQVILNERVTNVNQEGVQVGDKFIETQNVIWAAGNAISPLLKSLNTELDRAGRVIVEKDCSIKNRPDVFVIGDSALFIENGKPLPGVAPVAIQQGKYVAKIIKKDAQNKERKPFKYFDKGDLATIGRARAVMQIGGIKLSGFVAWLAWVFVHILYLISFRNRYKVLSEWMWYYVRNRHGIRLITHKTDL